MKLNKEVRGIWFSHCFNTRRARREREREREREENERRENKRNKRNSLSWRQDALAPSFGYGSSSTTSLGTKSFWS